MPHPEETAAFRKLPDDLQEPEVDPKEPKDAILSAPKRPEEWSEQCKWFGKYGLYDCWRIYVFKVACITYKIQMGLGTS